MLIETLSAPALNAIEKSLIVLIPPPTVIGTKTLFVVSTAKEILSKIKANKIPSGRINKEDIFRSNSLYNGEEALIKILQEGNVN